MFTENVEVRGCDWEGTHKDCLRSIPSVFLKVGAQMFILHENEDLYFIQSSVFMKHFIIKRKNS